MLSNNQKSKRGLMGKIHVLNREWPLPQQHASNSDEIWGMQVEIGQAHLSNPSARSMCNPRDLNRQSVSAVAGPDREITGTDTLLESAPTFLELSERAPLHRHV